MFLRQVRRILVHDQRRAPAIKPLHVVGIDVQSIIAVAHGGGVDEEEGYGGG